MEFELGMKLTSEADDFVSDLRIAKGRAGPVFLSQETEALFILTVHLKGYKRGNVKIDINEDGTLLAISGERRVKETTVVGQRVYKNDTVVKRFKKVFRIPDGVILDEIAAQFNEESTLMITMPKKVKVIRGTAIEEVEGQPELVKEGSGNLDIAETNRVAETSDRERDDGKSVRDDTADDQMQAEEAVKPVDHEIQETTRTEQDTDHDQQERQTQDSNKTNDDAREEEGREGETGDGPEREHRDDKRCKMCIPIIAGSTLLLSFVVFVIRMIRSKNQTSRRRD